MLQVAVALAPKKSKTLEKCRDSEEEVEGRLAFRVQRITHCRSRGVRGLLKLGETQAEGGWGSKKQWEGLLLPCFLAAVRGGRCQRGTLRPDILAKAYTALQRSLGPKHITEATLTQRVGGQQRSK